MKAPDVAWLNIRSLTSALIEAGLVTEFNGTLRCTSATRVEIDASPITLEQPPFTSRIDLAHDGFFAEGEYAQISRTRDFTARFIDGAMVQFFCVFDDDKLIRQRLTFYQCPLVKPYDDKYDEYNSWIDSADDLDQELHCFFAHDDFRHRDIVNLRLEYSPSEFVPLLHPRTHLHLNAFETCRIPVSAPVGVAAFFRFIVKNFYSRAWPQVKHKLVDQAALSFGHCIHPIERAEMHIHFE